MDAATLALALGLGSAVLLASANAFVKASGDIMISRAALSLSAALMVAPFTLFVPAPTPDLWLKLAISIPVHFLYQIFLIRALHRGDLSFVFPVMRGAAPLLTAIAAFAILGEGLPVIAAVGLLIACAATLVFALPEGAGKRHTRLQKSALFWALMTSAGVALYNIVDAWAVRSAESVYTFIVWMFLLDAIAINVAALIFRRGAYWSGMNSRIGYGVAAGALTIGSYGLALYGFSIAPVAYIAALRETSVVFAALLGWLLLKEGFGPRRTIAALTLAGGLILFRVGDVG